MEAEEMLLLLFSGLSGRFSILGSTKLSSTRALWSQVAGLGRGSDFSGDFHAGLSFGLMTNRLAGRCALA